MFPTPVVPPADTGVMINKRAKGTAKTETNTCVGPCPYAQAYYEKKLKRTGERMIAIKSVAAKLARATYYVLKNGVECLLINPFTPFQPFISRLYTS